MQIKSLEGKLLYSDAEDALKQTSLESFKFLEADLENAKMMGINLCGVTFEGGMIDNADFSEANLENSLFEGMCMCDTCFRKANLRNVEFYYVISFRADFREACLAGARFFGVDFAQANFSDANLQDAIFTKDNMGGATDISGANLIGANLTNTKFYGVIYDSKTKFPEGFDPTKKDMVTR